MPDPPTAAAFVLPGHDAPAPLLSPSAVSDTSIPPAAPTSTPPALLDTPPTPEEPRTSIELLLAPAAPRRPVSYPASGPSLLSPAPRRYVAPLHDPPDSRTAPLPPPILKPSSAAASTKPPPLWARPRDWFSLPLRLSIPTSPGSRRASLRASKPSSLVSALRRAPTPPRIHSAASSVRSDDLPVASLMKRVRFPVFERTHEFVFDRAPSPLPPADSSSSSSASEDHPPRASHLYTPPQVWTYYQQACSMRSTPPLPALQRQLTHPAFSFALDLSHTPLDYPSADPLADALALPFNLRSLCLDHCNLHDDALKIILHSLLLVDQLKELSLNHNPALSSLGFKYAAIYIKKSTSLVAISLCHTRPDRRAFKYIAHAISSPHCSLRSLALDHCHMQHQHLSLLVPAIIRSRLVVLSLANNDLGPAASDALCDLIDTEPPQTPSHPSLTLEKPPGSPPPPPSSPPPPTPPAVPDPPTSPSSPPALESINVSQNNLGASAHAIALCLRRNTTLKILRLANNRLDPSMLSLMAESLSVNRALELLDLSDNPVCGPDTQAIADLKAAMSLNTSLRALHLANTQLASEGAILLAELLPETKTLQRLDVSRNPGIDMAGVLALAVSARINHSLVCLDLDIKPGDADMSRLSQDILNSCIRNTERAAQAQDDARRAGL